MKQIGVKSMKHIVGAGVLLMMALIIHPLFAGSRQAHLWCVPGFGVGTEEWRVEAAKVERSDLMTARLLIGNFNALGKRMPKRSPIRNGGVISQSPVVGEALLKAVGAGDQAKVRELLSKGADPNFKGSRNMTPLGVFVSSKGMKKNLPILQMLLERGADPNKVWGDCGTTPFYYLVQLGFYGEAAEILPAVRLMLKHGADPNRKQGLFGLTPFGYAVTRSRSPDMDLVRAIAEHGGIVTQEMVDKVTDEKVKVYLQNHLKANAAKGKNEKGRRQ